MDDFRLKVFLAAARTSSFTRAAAQFGISQPAVSKQIGRLEAQYGVRLFVRRGNRLELTDAGRTMLACAERLDDDYRRLRQRMSLCTATVAGELRLGASTTVAQYLLPALLARFTSRYPGVQVSLLSGNSDRIETALEERAIDLGVVEKAGRRQGLHYAACMPDELVLIARPEGRYAAVESLSPGELRTVPLVLREEGSGTLEVIARTLAGAGIRLPMLRTVLRLDSTEAIKGFVRHSDAMAVVSVISVVDELRSGTLRIVDIDGISFRRDFSFVHAGTGLTPLSERFVAFVQDELRRG